MSHTLQGKWGQETYLYGMKNCSAKGKWKCGRLNLNFFKLKFYSQVIFAFQLFLEYTICSTIPSLMKKRPTRKVAKGLWEVSWREICGKKSLTFEIFTSQTGNCVSPLQEKTRKWLSEERGFARICTQRQQLLVEAGVRNILKTVLMTHSLNNRLGDSSVKWPIPNYHQLQSNGKARLCKTAHEHRNCISVDRHTSVVQF